MIGPPPPFCFLLVDTAPRLGLIISFKYEYTVFSLCIYEYVINTLYKIFILKSTSGKDNFEEYQNFIDTDF